MPVVPDNQIESIVALYLAGSTPRDIATSIGRSPKAVSQLLRSSQIAPRIREEQAKAITQARHLLEMRCLAAVEALTRGLDDKDQYVTAAKAILDRAGLVPQKPENIEKAYEAIPDPEKAASAIRAAINILGPEQALKVLKENLT